MPWVCDTRGSAGKWTLCQSGLVGMGAMDSSLGPSILAKRDFVHPSPQAR